MILKTAKWLLKDYIFSFAIHFAKSEDNADWGFAVVDVRVISFYGSIKSCGVDYNGHCVCSDIRSFLRTTNFK